MKCYSYLDGKIENKLIADSGEELTTCSLTFSVPPDWNVKQLLSEIKDSEFCDTLLHVKVKVIPGDSVSSVFPKGCLYIRCMNGSASITNLDNNAVIVSANKTSVDFILKEDSVLYDSKNKLYIYNQEGEPQTSDIQPEANQVLPLEEFVIEL